MSELPGSERSIPGAARDLGPADPHEVLEISVLVRRRNRGAFAERLARLHRGGGADPHLSREAFAQTFGAADADIAAVAAFAAGAGLTVSGSDAARRTVRLKGEAAAFATAFQVSLRRIEAEEGAFRGRSGPIRLPDELDGVVEAVLGLDNRPQARSQHRVSRTRAVSYAPTTVADLYGFPAGTGAGQGLAIVELGGGFTSSDLATYFTGLGVSPAPSVTAVSVDGAANAPTGSADGPDGEVMLDIEVAGSIAPGAAIAVYFAPNTDAGFIDAVTTAAHDATRKPSVISISWGGPESAWTGQAIAALDQAIAAAATMGVTVCVASGDNGSSDGASGGDHVDFPASSPHALACGGTSLRASGQAIAGESVWNDGAGGGAGGGGVSASFALPAWQQGLSVTRAGGAKSALGRRGVPDVAGDADPETGYAVRVDGENTVVGGTSAVAPLWAALIARINGGRATSVGFVNPALYARPSAFNDITAGNNGDFAASPGWDACTGLGSPKGAAIRAALGG